MTFTEIHNATARLAIEYGASTDKLSVTTHAEGYGPTTRLHFRLMVGAMFGTGDNAEKALFDLRQRLQQWQEMQAEQQANRPQTDAERRLALLGEVA